jgi:hypothetical protein
MDRKLTITFLEVWFFVSSLRVSSCANPLCIHSASTDLTVTFLFEAAFIFQKLKWPVTRFGCVCLGGEPVASSIVAICKGTKKTADSQIIGAGSAEQMCPGGLLDFQTTRRGNGTVAGSMCAKGLACKVLAVSMAKTCI